MKSLALICFLCSGFVLHGSVFIEEDFLEPEHKSLPPSKIVPLFGASSECEDEVAVVLTRGDGMPTDVSTVTDPYFEGYIQALVDMHYSEYRVVVLVKNRKIWLANLPKNRLIANSIVSIVKDVPGVRGSHFRRSSCKR